MKKLILIISILAIYANSNAQKVSTKVIDNKGTIKWVLDSTTAVITRADSTIIFVTPKQLRDSLAKVVYKAGNGLTKQGDSIILGGTLSSSTTIATSATNFLRITGLQSGNLNDSIMTVNPATGQLRIISVAQLTKNFAINGLNRNGDTTKLGGNLTDAATTINVNGKTLTVDVSTASSQFRINGLSSGAATDSVLVADPATGQVKRVSSSKILTNLKASNGITKSGDTVQLGGALAKATTITTTATNTLSVSGLQSGNLATDSIVVADGATGQLKRVSSAIQSGETSFTATVGQTSYSVSGMPANPSRVWVYRNGAKLVGGSNSTVTSDYTVTAGTVTLVLNGYSIIAGDIIEVQWVK